MELRNLLYTLIQFGFWRNSRVNEWLVLLNIINNELFITCIGQLLSVTRPVWCQLDDWCHLFRSWYDFYTLCTIRKLMNKINFTRQLEFIATVSSKNNLFWLNWLAIWQSKLALIWLLHVNLFANFEIKNFVLSLPRYKILISHFSTWFLSIPIFLFDAVFQLTYCRCVQNTERCTTDVVYCHISL